MELTHRSHRRLQKPSISINFQLPLYLRSILGLSLGVLVVVSGVMALTRLVQSPTNPFSAFSDLFGSAAGPAALARGFTCRDTGGRSHPQNLSGYCAQRDTDKMFSGIYLWMAGDNANEISFSLRENTLTLGDLMLLWGQPEIRLYCEVLVAAWPARHITSLLAAPRTRQITYFSPVLSVSFTRSGVPQWGRVLMNDALHNCGSGGV